MPLFGELFISEVLKKPVLDPKGEVLGRVRDVIVVKGDPLPRISALIIEKKNQQYKITWEQLALFNKRIISSYLSHEELIPYEENENDLLAQRDLINKQIVDANGATVVRAKDVKLEGYDGEAVLIAVDIGISGVLRRLGLENISEKLLKAFNLERAASLISWNYIQPLKPNLKRIALTVPQQIISELHPADLAEIISKVPKEEGRDLLKTLDIETAAEAISELSPEMQTEIISEMDADKAADLIEEMPPDEAADLLSELSEEKAHEILQKIEKEEAADIQELLVHEENSAGGMMTNQFISYFPEMSVAEAIEQFKKDAEDIETVYYVYVVDQQERLVGVTSLRELLLADSSTKLSDIMETKIKTTTPEEDVETVADMMSKYDLVAMPVVDEEGVFHGIVTVDDIMDVMEEEATEDIYHVAGTSELRYGSIEDANPVAIVKSRLPWLILCLVGGLISSMVIHHYEDTLTAVVVIASFIPVIMGMAGNSGLQVSTTLVRNIALDSINSYWRYVAKELVAGCLIAAITGTVIALVAGLLKGMPILGVVVGLSMFLAISSSTILALLTPKIADKFGIDPAVTAGPFVTVFNDILGLSIYFTVASIFISYLR
ncbi:MAG: magnesium transporter [Dissulfurispiraceae bacterium]|jgi:magnesium transporter|nr:magnesium transporter [Dissulfurispiraceae bacterium]